MKKNPIAFLMPLILCLGTTHAVGMEAFSPLVVRPELSLLAMNHDDGVSPIADVYALTLENPESYDINAINLDLTPDKLGVSQFIVAGGGGFLNPSDLGCGAGGVFPCVRGFSPSDSFIVLPEGLSPLSVFEVFASDQIRTAYTVPRGFLIPPNGSATIAHLSVPAGEPASLAGLRLRATLGEVAFRTPSGPVWSSPLKLSHSE